MGSKPKDQSYLRLSNTKMLLDVIAARRPVTRADLAKIASMSPTSISRIVAELLECGLVRETGEYSQGIGRRAMMLDLHPQALYALGFSVDRDRIQACMVNYLSETVALELRELPGHNMPIEQVIHIALELYHKILARHRVPMDRVLGAGVSMAGLVASNRRNVLLSPQFGWENVPLAAAFEEVLHLPIVLENDVKASLVGEMHLLGIPPDTDTTILSIGSGVGSAASAGGVMIRGQQNAAGEVGHIIIDRVDGMSCECGRRGCLQTHLATLYLLERARRNDPSVESLADIRRHYDAGDTWAKALIADCAEHICFALEILAGMYNPSYIVMGGSFFDQFESILPDITEYFNRRALLPTIAAGTLMLSASRRTAGVLGSALMAKSAFLSGYLERALSGLETEVRSSPDSNTNHAGGNL